ncbi:MAG: nucleotidyltransferase family protein [Deltaproteobacteria bacterium]|nr:nucleotidyltransferase family protein [Deltaproteobacteria bacterium]
MSNRPEVDLLLCCARTSLDSKRMDRVRNLLHSQIDWPQLIQMASAHGLTPLLYYNLQKTSPDLVPPTTLDQLRNHFLSNAARNIFLADELNKIINLFEAQGISALPLKGPVLASCVYGNLALRVSSDLDILVHKRDVLKAKDLLASLDYRPKFSLPPAQEEAFLDSHDELFLIHKSGKALVELHWRITPRDFPLVLSFEHFAGRLEHIPFESRIIPTFTPEDYLLILSLHGSMHCWEQLNWVCDVAELIRVHKEIDWDQLMKKAISLGCKRILLLGLFLARDLLETDLPAGVLKKVQEDPAVKSLANSVRQRLFQKVEAPLGILERSLFYWKVSGRLRHRVGYCLRLVFTPTVGDWKPIPLPPSVSFLYYLIHPLRVAGKYGRICLRRLFLKETFS